MSKSEKTIVRLWRVCDDGWTIRASCDQWWVVTAACPHGEWKGYSNGALDLDRAFVGVANSVEEGHPDAVSRGEGGGWMHQCWKVQHEVWSSAGVRCVFCGRKS